MGKSEIYQQLDRELEALLSPDDDAVSAMANFAAAVHHALPYASWTGFYRMVGRDRLRVGPFQGPNACVEIPLGQGVCGAAAKLRTTQVVPDVHAFPGHIACDAKARSEIVVPVVGPSGDLVAVLDIDSHELSAFDDDDRIGLEGLVRHLQAVWPTDAERG